MPPHQLHPPSPKRSRWALNPSIRWRVLCQWRLTWLCADRCERETRCSRWEHWPTDEKGRLFVFCFFVFFSLGISLDIIASLRIEFSSVHSSFRNWDSWLTCYGTITSWADASCIKPKLWTVYLFCFSPGVVFVSWIMQRGYVKWLRLFLKNNI